MGRGNGRHSRGREGHANDISYHNKLTKNWGPMERERTAAGTLRCSARIKWGRGRACQK